MDNEWIQREQQKLLERLQALALKEIEIKKELKELRQDAIRLGYLINRQDATDDLAIDP
jgi:hypothetical protein